MVDSVKKRVLFVCLGNICRSPGAEAVFRALIEKKGLGGDFEIDSAGTSDWHEGEHADQRMQRHAQKRGYNLTSLSRTVKPETDFEEFDYIVAMDRENLKELKRIAPHTGYLRKLFLITDFSHKYDYDGVPDPYYGGEKSFELVIDLLEDASEGLLAYIQR